MFKYRKGLFISLLIGLMLLSSFAEATVPNAPGSYVGVSKLSSTSVRISTKDNSDNEDGFYVLVYDYETSNLVQRKQISDSNNSHIYADFTGLVCDKLYLANVLAFNKDGNSSVSDTRNFNIHTTFSTTCPDDIDVPTAPGSYIGVTDINKSAVRVNFLDNSDNEDGFLLFDESGDINVTVPANNATAPSQTYVTLTGLTCDKTYTIKALAFNENGNSEMSDAQAFNIHSTFGVSCGNPLPDITKPVITLLGDATVILTVGDTYTDAGATAMDDVDGNITANIQTTSDVNTSAEGNYTVTYEVNDTAGNVADIVTRTVMVNVVALGKLQGKVVDLSGNPIGGAIVNVETKEKVTDANGNFYFDNLDISERSILLASHQDYITNSRIIKINGSVETRLTIVLSKANSSQSFASNFGVTVSQSDGASIVLPPDIYVDREGNRYDGDINLSLSYYPITTQNGRDLFPGNFDAINQDNERGTLQSYGFVLISLEDSSGNPLDINGSATISLPADSSLGTPLPVIPLWYYDENRGIWIEDGEATYNTSTGRYEGEITRIATYNLDVFINPANLKVCVEDTNGTKLSNAYVQLKNQTLTWYANVGPTSQDGYINILGALGETDLNVSAYTFDGRYGEYSDNPINLISGQDNELDSCIVINDKNSSTVDVNLTKGLVAHYEFEGNADDSSGNENDGTEHGGVSYVDGMIGQAGRFDGVDDWIKINHIKNITNTDNIALTFSLWLNLDTDVYGINQVFEAHVPSGEFFLEGDTIQKFESFPTRAISTDILDTDKWINIILVFDGDKKEKKIYINGILNKKIDIFQHYIKLTTGLTIGRDYESAIQYLNGKIDDFRIYNRALNEAEIKELYKLGEEKNAIYYKDFAITKKGYEETSNLDEIVQNTFGSEYRIADWEDLEKFYYDKNGDLLDLFDNLNLKEYGDSAYVTWHGNRIWRGRRHYYASRHEHNKPSYYLDHANIDNNLISLGSWYNMKTNILVVKKSF